MSSNQYTEEQYQTQITSLIELINRLSSSARGLKPEIDAKLAKFKAISKQDPTDLEPLHPLIKRVTLSIQREQARLEQQRTQIHKLAADTVRAMLEFENITTEQRDQARTLLDRMSTPFYSHSELSAVLIDVLSIQCNALVNLRGMANGSQQVSSDIATLESSTLPALQNELSNVLASIELKEHGSTSLARLRQKLLHPNDATALLDICLSALKLIIRGVNDERQAAQSFLTTLNDTLDSVGTALATALQGHEQTVTAQGKLSVQLQQHIEALSAPVAPAATLTELQHHVQQQARMLSTTLTCKLELEEQERKRLRAELISMQARLEDVESETRLYRRQLSEQEFPTLQDPLTRLPNHIAFEERLQLEYQRWQSYATPVCVAVAKIDSFQVISETYGNPASDKTLQVIANILKKSLRGTDFVGRFEGQDFVIIFPQTQTETALELLKKACHRIKSIPFKFKQESISITLSAGVSSLTANDSPTRVFDRAKHALSQAIDNGHDRVSYQ